MKNFNLSLIALICGSFLFMHNSCLANTTSRIVKYRSDLTKNVPEDGIDPDWIKLVAHYKVDVVKTQL
ncbi:hypothetical protein J2W95_000045 [Flavobacterium granuli]|uniref:Uncharacterized protein n=1 Tax=Flavobacterium granuli TaxID=280093 RepID=A0ABU1RZG5_9FLAO|nr:hypothetical protein [Flavobacterium granuli]